jgi:hypothetical protein
VAGCLVVGGRAFQGQHQARDVGLGPGEGKVGRVDEGGDIAAEGFAGPAEALEVRDVIGHDDTGLEQASVEDLQI